jgi:hypothetical protein
MRPDHVIVPMQEDRERNSRKYETPDWYGGAPPENREYSRCNKCDEPGVTEELVALRQLQLGRPAVCKSCAVLVGRVYWHQAIVSEFMGPTQGCLLK